MVTRRPPLTAVGAAREVIGPMSVADMAVARVAPLAAAYEQRWTLAALRRVDPELHARFVEQRDDWHRAMVTAEDAELRRQTEAMARGWQAVTRRMEEAAPVTGAPQPDDAYMVGVYQDQTIVIGACPSTAAWARAVYGRHTLFVTPDEVAAVIVGLGDTFRAVKELWPTAEVLEVREKTAEEPPAEAAQ